MMGETARLMYFFPMWKGNWSKNLLCFPFILLGFMLLIWKWWWLWWWWLIIRLVCACVLVCFAVVVVRFSVKRVDQANMKENASLLYFDFAFILHTTAAVLIWWGEDALACIYNQTVAVMTWLMVVSSSATSRVFHSFVGFVVLLLRQGAKGSKAILLWLLEYNHHCIENYFHFKANTHIHII